MHIGDKNESVTAQGRQDAAAQGSLPCVSSHPPCPISVILDPGQVLTLSTLHSPPLVCKLWPPEHLLRVKYSIASA